MQTPISTQNTDKFHSSDEFVEVVFHVDFRCKLCGYIPDSFGCIPKMEKHLKEKHAIEPPDGKWFWIGSPSDADIRKGLGFTYA